MCEDCRTQLAGHYEGKKLVLEPTRCPCDCESHPVILGENRCEKCDHMIRGYKEVTSEVYEEPLVLKNGYPIRNDEAWTGEGKLEA